MTASTVTLRAADLLAVLLLAAWPPRRWSAGSPATSASGSPGPRWSRPPAGGVGWTARLRRGGARAAARRRSPLALAAVAAWVLEAAVVWEVARVAGSVAVPRRGGRRHGRDDRRAGGGGDAGRLRDVRGGGDGSAGRPRGGPRARLRRGLTTHAVKTAYALVVGGVALAVPAPVLLGRLRLPRAAARGRARCRSPTDAPVVAFLPVHDEEASVGEVVRVPPPSGRRVEAIVVDDGSTDATAGRRRGGRRDRRRAAAQPRAGGRGPRGPAEASARRPAAVVYLDADGEYFPEDIATVVAPVLDGRADYVVGSRFAGDIRRMLPHRRFGNQVLTWLSVDGPAPRPHRRPERLPGLLPRRGGRRPR